VAAAALGLLALAIVGSWHLRVYFGRVSLDQLWFHLEQGGLGGADPKTVWRGVRTALLWALLTAGLVAGHQRLRRGGRVLFWLVLLGATGLSLASTVKPGCDDADEGDFIAQHYVDPRSQTVIAPAQRPDLLLVYVESLDSAYAGRRAFGEPLVPQLAQWRAGQTRFGRLHMLDGASWTMAGLFSSLCGLPLQSVGLITAKSTDRAERFFSDGQCLTDWLAALGWEVSFYGGATLDFAGKGRFFAEHGVRRRFGREAWRALGVPVPEEGWGLADTALAGQVIRQLAQPRVAQQPRASIVLTVNSHDPHGNPDPDCPTPEGLDDAGRLRTALRCSDAAVVRLVNAFVQQRDGRPKVVWIMGDHLSKAHPLMPELEAAAEVRPRGIFHVVGRWDANGQHLPTPPPAQDRQFTHLDVAPTLAQLLGLRWSPHGDRVGLGQSLVAEPPAPTLMEQRGLQPLNRRLSCPSPQFADLWT
jgi:phosphoglycerol transferase